MVAMRLPVQLASDDVSLIGGRRGRRRVQAEAYPVNARPGPRILRPVALEVEAFADDGLCVASAVALEAGQRVALVFPDNPFLPRSGTVARVDSCVREGTRWTVELSYETASAA